MVIIRTFADTDPVLTCDHIFHDLLIVILAPEEEGGQYCNHVCLFVCLSVNIVRKLYLRWGSVLPKHDPNLERDFRFFKGFFDNICSITLKLLKPIGV